jgi:hypothetical protein
MERGLMVKGQWPEEAEVKDEVEVLEEVLA